MSEVGAFAGHFVGLLSGILSGLLSGILLGPCGFDKIVGPAWPQTVGPYGLMGAWAEIGALSDAQSVSQLAI